MKTHLSQHAIFLISCADQKGITSAVTTFVYQNGGNIISADQHIDEQSNTFFMRIEWSLAGFKISQKEITKRFEPIAQRFKMIVQLYFTQHLPRAAIFVSQHLHCLYDLLLRQRSGQLKCEIPLIISNHRDARAVAKEFKIPFLYLEMSPEKKHKQELKQIQALKKAHIDFIILARYHQIFTREFVAHFPNRMINIHHSFLPAFAGKSPYDQAYRKGVKIIGATSHFVIDQLDEGPIIEQDTVRISHRDAIDDLKRKGQDLEKIVLSRAVRWYLEHKILTYGNKTVIFE